MNQPLAPSRKQLRRGVTLLEVLFSIGIISVGLLGTIVLIPLAAHEANEGAKADRSAAFGKSMVNEFQIRFMKDPSAWLLVNGNTAFNANQTTVRQAFLIDPRLIAAFNANLVINNVNGNINSFPYTNYSAGDYAPMTRVTLPSGDGGVMGLLQADEVFISQDDLVFAKPDDSLLPPVQEWSKSAEWPPNDIRNNVKRQSEGKYSWIATLAPKIDRSVNQTDPDVGTGSRSDLYTMSVIVFYERDASFEMSAVNERIVTVSAFPGLGIGGGDVTLRAIPASMSQAADLEVRRNQWVMLFGNSSDGPIYRWYRIVGVDDIDPNASPLERSVTLLGQDWDRDEFVNVGPNNPTTYVAIVKGIIAVYEKTIRFESSSLWN